MGFKSERELKNFLLDKCERALILAEEDVYRIIDRFIRDYYGEFNPVMYDRTMQLFNSFVMTDLEWTGNGYRAYIYFDLDGIKYKYGSQPSGEEVMESANRGEHGVEKIAYSNGTKIWDDPMKRVSSHAIDILAGRLMQQGIPIKKK